MKKTIILFMSTIVLLSASCKKDSSEPSNTEKICGKNWRVVALTVNPGITIGTVTVTDYLAQIPSCSKDDFSTFNTNGTYTDDEGASKCSPSDPQTTSGTWKFNSNETIVTLDNTDSYTILINDGSTLKYTFSQVDATSGINYVYTATLNK